MSFAATWGGRLQRHPSLVLSFWKRRSVLDCCYLSRNDLSVVQASKVDPPLWSLRDMEAHSRRAYTGTVAVSVISSVDLT